MVKQKNAVYPLSADPIHNGHLQNIAVAVNSGLFDKVTVAVGNNPAKKYLFNLNERLSLVERAVYSAGFDGSRVEVLPFSGLLRNYALVNGMDFIIRGSRNSKDFEYEQTLSDFNSEYGLETFILPASVENRTLSSSVVKAIVTEGGLVNKYVHPAVKQALEERIQGLSLLGVTGNMGAGKTTFCQRLVEYAQVGGSLQVSHIDFDKLVHSLYFGDSQLSLQVRQQIERSFGADVFDSSGLNRKKLAGIVFGNNEKKEELSRIIMTPSIIKFEEELRKRKGIVLVDAAYLTEYNMLPLVNYNVILVGCNEEERFRRVLERDKMTRTEVEAKTKAQHPQELKRKIMKEAQEKQGHGFFLEVDSNTEMNLGQILGNIQASFPLFKSGARTNAIA